ncbi:13521_t:CDS:10 [Funneliformis mosseae]|uniref:DNA damage-inducible protein 1 n=1 Tax=Funneliformis mosseae TaxID=27381 RepID=A0A9N8VWE4_FUNMO|nr:13521_t:CDS:10 [Funneliformis mosseae]
MRIAFTTETGEVHNLEIDSQMELENIKALIEAEIGTAPANQILFYHGQELTDPKKTLEQYGVVQDEILLLKIRPSNNQSSSSVGTPGEYEFMRQTLLSRPDMLQQLRQNQSELANAVNDPQRFTEIIQEMAQRRHEGELQRMQQINMLNEDPYDVEKQRSIEEAIRMQNVLANFSDALEHNPESFGRVTMLYIDVEVNGHPVKAFVDSGAQATIMSPQCAESCGIMRLVDNRFAGIAKGVGTAKIIGRVHSAQIRVGTDLFLICSFTIMEGRGTDLLFGLDMLKRHQACIDLQKNALIINGKEIRFLAEHELPESARMEMDESEEHIPHNLASSSASNTESPSISSSTIVNPPSSNSSPPVSQQQSQYPDEHIQNLISMGGITRDEAIKLLDAAGGNVEIAASLLFG